MVKADGILLRRLAPRASLTHWPLYAAARQCCCPQQLILLPSKDGRSRADYRPDVSKHPRPAVILSKRCSLVCSVARSLHFCM